MSIVGNLFLAVLAVLAPSSAAEPAPAPQAADFRLSGSARQGALLTGIVPEGARRLLLDGDEIPFAADRRFIVAFDRDHGPSAELVAELADGRRLTSRFAVAPGAWKLERIDVARRPSIPDEAYRRLRERELARIAAARAADAPAEGWRQTFVWPVRGRISGAFGAQRIYRGEPAAFHTGLDIAPGAGAPVVAPADGKVVLAGPPMFSLEGNLVIIDHGMGLNSAFLHLATYEVREGQQVRQGQRIGTVGATGRATGPHLHWSVKWRDARIDPQVLVQND